jgi:phosphopantothenoylcysteine decarboxylase/phosphopantothenate--cysteine ligase
MLEGKKILLGVTGSIAAYKSASLIRLLVKAGANVQVIMSSDAKEFISALTLSTLSKNPVYSEFIKNDNGEWTNHVDLALWADLFLIAPASANTIAKMANGICDNLLLATYLSAKCDVVFATAMDLDMYKHPTTLKNINSLKSFGNLHIESTSGELASGLIGEGRMAEPEEIVEFVKNHFQKKKDLANKTILITAGPTYEALDPVRFIGNHSSGKMGYELANECASRGAKVVLVSGPSHEKINHINIELIKVQSADEMYQACTKVYSYCDVAIMSAAVADYTPKNKSAQKIKKNTSDFSIDLIKTVDILKSLGDQKTKQILVGFALETENEIENAFTKLERKNADFIVLNSLNDDGAGFGYDTNKIRILFKNKNIKEYSIKSKKEVAVDIIEEVITLLN